MPLFLNEIGNIYGRLKVITEAGRTKRGQAIWLCECECGTRKKVQGGNLRCGNTQSCGCFQQRTHGMTHTPEYRAWQNIKDRCSNPSNTSFKDYGGRGISMDENFQESFVDWLAEVGMRPPGNGMSIDRIDNSKGYVAGNMAWRSKFKQATNTRRVVLTQKMADSIRALRLAGESAPSIARSIGCKVHNVRNVIYGRAWQKQ